MLLIDELDRANEEFEANAQHDFDAAVAAGPGGGGAATAGGQPAGDAAGLQLIVQHAGEAAIAGVVDDEAGRQTGGGVEKIQSQLPRGTECSKLATSTRFHVLRRAV